MVMVACRTCGGNVRVLSERVVVACIRCRKPDHAEPTQTPKPGWWIKVLTRLQTPEDIGLGATVKRIAAKVGGERFKRWAKRIGLPCGCTDREAQLNARYPNPRA